MAGSWEIKKIADLGLAHLPVNSIMSIYVKTTQEVTDLRVLGWWLCDGTEYATDKRTPDLRGQFIMGGQPGNNVTGEGVDGTTATDNHTPSVSDMASHTHFGWAWQSSNGSVGGDKRTHSKSEPTDLYMNENGATGVPPGGNEPHNHSVNTTPDHIQIGYFMYTGIPG